MPEARWRLTDGLLLRRLMQAPGSARPALTPRDLAEAAGLSESKIAKLLRGTRPTVTESQADRIATAVGVARGALFLPTSSSSADADETGETPMTPEERTLRARLAAHASHAKNPDAKSRTAAARAAAAGRFEAEAREMHPDASDEEIARVAKHLRKGHFTRMALASAQARRQKAAAKPAA